MKRPKGLVQNNFYNSFTTNSEKFEMKTADSRVISTYSQKEFD